MLNHRTECITYPEFGLVSACETVWCMVHCTEATNWNFYFAFCFFFSFLFCFLYWLNTTIRFMCAMVTTKCPLYCPNFKLDACYLRYCLCAYRSTHLYLLVYRALVKSEIIKSKEYYLTVERYIYYRNSESKTIITTTTTNNECTLHTNRNNILYLNYFRLKWKTDFIGIFGLIWCICDLIKAQKSTNVWFDFWILEKKKFNLKNTYNLHFCWTFKTQLLEKNTKFCEFNFSLDC